MPKASHKWILATVIVLHLAIALPSAYYLNIWVDEASSLYATENGLWVALQNSAAEQKQAPLYFWILSLWRDIDKSIFFARLFSITCSVAAIMLFAGLAYKIFDRRFALALTAVFGLHPFLIWASLEIRVYSLVILVSVILFRLFLEAFWRGEPGKDNSRLRYPQFWFFIAVVTALYIHYYLGFLIAGFFVSLLACRMWHQARRFAFLMIGAALAFSPLLWETALEFQSKTSGFQEVRTLTEGARIIWSHVLTFILPTEVLPEGDQSFPSFLRLWLVRGGIVAVAGVTLLKIKQITSLTVGLAFITVVIGILLIAAFFVIGGPYIQIRHASVLFVSLILFLASLVTDLCRNMHPALKRVLATGIGALLAVSFIYSISVLYPNMTKRGDWARVAEFIQHNESEGQPIVLFEAFDALALPYYYRGVNPILPDENYFDFGFQAPFGTPESMVRQNEFVISEIPSDSHSIWLVVNDFCLSTEACRPLENYIAANYTIEIEKEFYVSKVYLLRAKAQ